MTDVHDRLLEAAAEVFAERGYERAGVAEIARRAGLTTGAIYSRYTGKAELMLGRVRCRHSSPGSRSPGRKLSGPGNSARAVAALGAALLDPADLLAQRLLPEAIVAGWRDPDLGERCRVATKLIG